MNKTVLKSVFGVFLTVCILLSFPLCAFADETESGSKKEGVDTVGGVTFTYVAENGVAAITGATSKIGKTLTLPDSIAGNKVVEIGEEAFSEGEFTAVTMPNSILTISDKAFYLCKNLEKITLSTEITSIGEKAFYGCVSLKSITIPDRVTTISPYMLYGCRSLETVKLPSKLSEINDYALYACESLTSLSLPDTLLYIGNFALRYCIGLNELKLPKNLRTLGTYSLYGCEGLKSVKIPASVTSIGDGSFLDCTKVEKFTVEADNKNYCTKDGVLYTKDMTELITFPRGRKDTAFTVPNGVTVLGAEAFSRTTLKRVKLPSTLQEIGDYALSETEIESIDLPKSLTLIGNDAFCKCASLKAVTLPDNVTSIGDEAFNECTALEKVTLSEKLSQIGSFAFSACVRLKKIAFPAELSQLGNAAFMGCTSLKTIEISKDNNWFTVKDGVLYNSNQTTLLYYPSGLTATEFAVPDTVTSVAAYAFAVNHHLTKITLPDSVTTLDERAFEYVTKIKTITLPETFRSLGAGVFAYCTSLEKINVPKENTLFKWENNTLLSADGYKLYFYSPANKAEKVTVPLSVAQLMDCSFAGNPYLKRVTLLNASSSIGSDVFDGCREDFVLSSYDESTARSYAASHRLTFEVTNEPLPTETQDAAANATVFTRPTTQETGSILEDLSPRRKIFAIVVLVGIVAAAAVGIIKSRR